MRSHLSKLNTFQKFASNAGINEGSRTITVKQEKLVIKNEREMDCDYPCRLEYVATKTPTEKIAELEKENTQLIEQLLSSKKEIMCINLQVKRHEDEMKRHKELHSNEVNALNQQIANLVRQIETLTKQKTLLNAQIKQLQQSVNVNMPTKTSTQPEKSDDEFEVECIEKHKTVRGTRLYFVRWKGFPTTDNQWIGEKDLFCPAILADYKKAKKLR